MDAVNHGLERFSLRVDFFMRWLFRPVDALLRGILPLADTITNRAAPLLAMGLFRTGLAVKVSEPDKHFSETAQALWREAKQRGIVMYEVRFLGLPRRHFVARYKDKTLAFEGLPRPARAQRSIHWIDDKAEVKKRFQAARFPVAHGRSVASERSALNVFNSLRQPVIVKPREGSGGRHTTVHIETESELRQAYHNARMISPAVMIEEELFGPVFRATLVDGKLVAVLRRDPPQVVGDGRSTVRELVAAENMNLLRRGPVFAEIRLDSTAAQRELRRQKLSPESIPAKGQKAYFHFKVNWGVGGTSRDATAEVHPENIKLFEDIGVYLGEDIAGIDFITQDIGRSWRDTERCGVIECNSLPLIGNHHFPYSGPVRNVAGAVWDMVFP